MYSMGGKAGENRSSPKEYKSVSPGVSPENHDFDLRTLTPLNMGCKCVFVKQQEDATSH